MDLNWIWIGFAFDLDGSGTKNDQKIVNFDISEIDAKSTQESSGIIPEHPWTFPGHSWIDSETFIFHQKKHHFRVQGRGNSKRF